MVRGQKAGGNRNFRKTVRSREKASDDSDEDYVISDEETDASEDALEDLERSALEDGLDNFEEDEVEVEDEGEEEEEENEEEENDSRKLGSKPRSSCSKKSNRKSPQRNRTVSIKEEDDEEYVVNDEDEDEDEDDDDDDEFTPEEEQDKEEEDDDDCLDDEEDSAVKKRSRSENGTRKSTLKRKVPRWGQRRKKRSKVSREVSRKKGTKRMVVRRKSQSDNDDVEDDIDDFLNGDARGRQSGIKNMGRRKRRYVASSDSDFVTSGSSDCEYTISEEEREQVREANDFCGTLVPCTRKSSTLKRLVRQGNLSLRSSSLCNSATDSGNLANKPKPTCCKGKEKVEELNVIKQVCGICLSEEDKRKVRGTLDCCSHYFCFTCIREWSKVESRCPLCKQRFHTISRPARCTAGIDLRDMVIQVPERDQVYQPTEEEIRGYLDPYESVICTECHQGGDDDLMLLCDICDSPAHTFCVGLGREVPEGSWYCDGCRPDAFGALVSQSQDHLPNSQRTNINLSGWTTPAAGVNEGFDLNVPPSIQVGNIPSPRFPRGLSPTPSPRFPRGMSPTPSPRFPHGMSPTPSPLSGAQASTLSGRRMIQRHIQLRNGRSPGGGRTDGSTSIFRTEPLPYPVDQGRVAIIQPVGLETRPPTGTNFVELSQEVPFPALQRREIPGFAAPSTSARLFLNGYAGINLISVPDQSHQSSSRLSISSDGGGAPPMMREESYFCRAEEQLQTMIKTHLGSLSREKPLDYGDLKDIERSSTHTILAACGLRQQGSEVCTVPLPLVCSHVDKTSNGQMSLMKGSCLMCFNVFVKEVVQNTWNAKRQQQWLSLGL